ncbi:MAG: hypothetical protein EAZ43_02385 [Betaproteobacteria bacterium]|nr:MAG: hypothetical protein EAZ43_02385 [Betaproteobacteria bacterium]
MPVEALLFAGATVTPKPHGCARLIAGVRHARRPTSLDLHIKTAAALVGRNACGSASLRFRRLFNRVVRHATAFGGTASVPPYLAIPAAMNTLTQLPHHPATAVALETTASVATGTPNGLSGVPSAIVPSATSGASGASVSAVISEIRYAGRSAFSASRLDTLKASNGQCVYCGAAANTGDHVKSVKKSAIEVVEGKISRSDAIKQANAPENIRAACTSCNSSEGAKDLSDTPGPGKWVPPNGFRNE